MVFSIKSEPEAQEDIQEGIDWYNKIQPGLGRRFHLEVKSKILKLKTNPFFQIRYDDVHCLPLEKFPFMIHYTINEADKIITIKAVFNTSKNPENWKRI